MQTLWNCQIFRTEKDPKGHLQKKGYLLLLVHGYNQIIKIICGCDLKIMFSSQILRCSIKWLNLDSMWDISAITEKQNKTPT